MIYSLIRPLLFRLNPEKAHYLTLNILKYLYPSWVRQLYLKTLPIHPIKICGLTFKNPIGLAAGLDKNGDYIHLLAGLGFGFIELGTVTPKPQSGNPKPRLFRIPEAQALINRMGFNNLGVAHLVSHLQHRPSKEEVIIGANIGKNKMTALENAADDYCYCLTQVYPYVDYVTINISSPNTPGLRQLQSAQFLRGLLADLSTTRQQLTLQYERQVPLWVKISPDLSLKELDDLVALFLEYQVDAVIATNTTIDHDEVARFANGQEEGGVSGLPLFNSSTRLIHELKQRLQGKIPIIGVGGVMSADAASMKLSAGATLVQLYSGLIYEGPQLIKTILHSL